VKLSSTLLLKGIVLLIGLIVFAFCSIVLPVGIRAESGGDYFPVLLGVYGVAIPFFIGLYQIMKLLSLIDAGKAFSEASVVALARVKACAGVICALCVAYMPYIYIAAENDDAPGVIMLGLIVVFASAVVAVLAALLQRLLGDALAIKSENDLTV